MTQSPSPATILPPSGRERGSLDPVLGPVQVEWRRAPVFTIGDGTGQNAMSHFAGNGQHVWCNVGGTQAGSDLWALTGLAPLSNWGSTPIDVVDVFNSSTGSMQTYINGTLDFTQSMNGNLLSLMPSSFFTLAVNVGVGGAGNGSSQVRSASPHFRHGPRPLHDHRAECPAPITCQTSPRLQARPTDHGPWLPRGTPRPFHEQ